MKVLKLLDTRAGMVVAAGAVVLVGAYLVEKKARQAASDVGQAVNPINPDNIFNQGVLAVGRNITGDEHWSLGGWIYDITH